MTKEIDFITKDDPDKVEKERKQIQNTLFNLFNLGQKNNKKNFFSDAWLKKV